MQSFDNSKYSLFILHSRKRGDCLPKEGSYAEINASRRWAEMKTLNASLVDL